MKSYKAISEAVNKASDLNDDEKAVLTLIVYIASIRNDYSLELGDEEIAEFTGISSDRIASITSSLVRKGYLIKKGVW